MMAKMAILHINALFIIMGLLRIYWLACVEGSMENVDTKKLVPTTANNPNKKRPTSNRTNRPFGKKPSPKRPTIKPSSHSPPTKKPSSKRPTLKPCSCSPTIKSNLETPRQNDFRTLLLDNNVSSSQSLFNQCTPQYKALDWLANKDGANLPLSTPFQTIQDRYVVAIFYFVLYDNPKYLSELNFLSNSSICDWNGIYCNPFKLEFGRGSSMGSLSTLPSEIGRLTDLRALSLYNNGLIGTIPTEIGVLSKLTSLNINSNQFSGTIPSTMGNLTNLEILDFTRNHLNGTLSSFFGGMTNLTLVSFELNHFSGTVPMIFGKLSKLDFLILDRNNFTGDLDPIFCSNSSNHKPNKLLEADCKSKLKCSCCLICD